MDLRAARERAWFRRVMNRFGAVLGTIALGTLALIAAATGCGGDDSGGSAGTTATGGSAGSSGIGGGAGDASSDAGSGGSAGSDAGSDGPVSDGWVPKPEPGDVSFAALAPLPHGEQLIFADWNPIPNTVSSILPDGTGETPIFAAYRVWSLGASHDGTKIAFACGDPLQEQHYGFNLGDAIQNTWLYDVTTESASILSYGNINDECHTWNASDDRIYVCRRYDFAADYSQSPPAYSNKGYRLGRIALVDGNIEWLVPEPPATELDLHPAPTADESTLYYTEIDVVAGKQTRKIMKKSLPGGTPELFLDQASAPVLSPDGTRLLYADTSQGSALFVMDLATASPVKVASENGTSAVWSPDGSKLAFLWGETQTCGHIDVVAADGSQADAPTRVRQCGSSFLTELAWIDVP
jgi:WD40-like Beta Propeller Repeat